MGYATQKVSGPESDISRVHEKLAASADFATRVCEATVEHTCVVVNRIRESLSADVEAAKLSIVESIESAAASLGYR